MLDTGVAEEDHAYWLNQFFRACRDDESDLVAGLKRRCEACIDAGVGCRSHNVADYAVAQFVRARHFEHYEAEYEHLLGRYIESSQIHLDRPIRSNVLYGDGMLPLDAAIAFRNAGLAVILAGMGAATAYAPGGDWNAFDRRARVLFGSKFNPRPSESEAESAVALMREARLRRAIAAEDGAAPSVGPQVRRRRQSL